MRGESQCHSSRNNRRQSPYVCYSTDPLLGLQEIISGMSACPSQLGGTTTGMGKATEIGVISLVASDCISLGRLVAGRVEMIQWAYADALILVIPSCITTMIFPLEAIL